MADKDTKSIIIHETDLPFAVFGKIVRDLHCTFRQQGSNLDIAAIIRGTFTGVRVEPCIMSRLFYRKTNSFRHYLGKLSQKQLDAMPHSPEGTVIMEVGKADIEAEGRRVIRGPVTDPEIIASVKASRDLTRLEALQAQIAAQIAAVKSGA